MDNKTSASQLLREVVRLYSRHQRAQVSCMDGASTVQCHVLNELLRNPGITQQHLVEKLGLDKSWISRAIDGLVKSGAVIKQIGTNDRRCVCLNLTSSGTTLANKLNLDLEAHAAQILNNVPRELHEGIQFSLRILLNELESTASISNLKGCATP